MRNIILIGFMGSGKTTFGSWLSRKKGYSFADTDDIIVDNQKRSINDIFEKDGENYFRGLETEVIESMLNQGTTDTVISVGGGLPIKEINGELLKKLGCVVYLKASVDTLEKRLSSDTQRPLLKGGNVRQRIETLMEKRADIYEQRAELIIETDNLAFEEIYERIEKHMAKKKILVINGPNLNFLGIRNVNVYGSQNYEYLLDMIKNKAVELGVEVECYQSNHEGAIIDRLQQAYFEHKEGKLDGIVINPGAYTHYSYAIHDALEPLEFPKIEVHISDIHSREDFRHISVTLPACTKQIAGKGLEGYCMAMEEIVNA